MKLKLSKSQWEQIGRIAGWSAIDPIEFSDADIDPSYDAQDEEDAILGEDEGYDFQHSLHSAYESGYAYSLNHDDTLGMPYRQDTDNGMELAKMWFQGFQHAKDPEIRNVREENEDLDDEGAI